jgi:hypothetical protein
LLNAASSGGIGTNLCFSAYTLIIKDRINAVRCQPKTSASETGKRDLEKSAEAVFELRARRAQIESALAAQILSVGT